MSILIVHVELNRADARSHKSRHSVFMKEVERGRRREQISANGTVIFVQTPEHALDFAKRLIERCGMDNEKDRLAVIDVSQGRAYIWGEFEANIKTKFPFLVQDCRA